MARKKDRRTDPRFPDELLPPTDPSKFAHAQPRSRGAIIAEALRWEGTRFIHQHYHRGHGCDCLGLPRGVGMAVFRFDATAKNPAVKPLANYGKQPEPAKLFAAMLLFCDPVAWVAEFRHLVVPRGSDDREVATGEQVCALSRPADLLVMRLDPRSQPSHVAILLPDCSRRTSSVRYLIHALESRGQVVRHRMDKRWADRVVAAFAFRGLTD